MRRIISHPGAVLGLAMAASLAVAGRDPFEDRPYRSREPRLPPQSAERQRQRAIERRERRKREDEFRERLLRQKIAEGKDNRDEKYLHSAARRRRQAALEATPLPSPAQERSEP